MSVATGILFHAIGAASAALCYVPQKKTRDWSWQTFWVVQAFCCWLLFPFLGAVITIPDLAVVLKAASGVLMFKVFLLGALYGIGGTAFGIAIRYVGFSLTYAIAIGISCVLGTLLPPFLRGELSELWSSKSSEWLISGILMGLAGIALCGIAGRFKERDLAASQKEKEVFSLRIGLPLCLFAGVLSSVYGIALDQGQPIADIAARHGAGNFQTNVIYIFVNSGALFTTLIYCGFRHRSEKTLSEFITLKKRTESGRLGLNYLMALFTGFLWYSQFFYYGLGHVRMGSYKFTSWAIHMIMLVLFSCFAGLIMREWYKCKAPTLRLLVLAIFSLITAVLLLTYGNYLAGEG